MDWEMLCRVCLQNGDLVSLFDSDENDELLSDKYTYCCNVEVTSTDQLPSQICLSCVDRLLTAYQFKQQCVSSFTTLTECLAEFKQATESHSEEPNESTDQKEVITIKQENGTYVQYEVPVEGREEWGSRQSERQVKRGRGRPRKYPNAMGEIALSPYQKRKESANMESTSSDMGVIKEERLDEDEDEPFTMMEGEDEDYDGQNDKTLEFLSEDGSMVQIEATKTKKARGRPRKVRAESAVTAAEEEEADDVLLLEETLLAETKQPDPQLTQPKPKKKYPKKRYFYEKTHTCEVCGSSFRSNASLQAHIRRHLGIKPFSCSICGYTCVLNMELRRHMMRHTGARPYQCRICERRFGDFGSRQKHERLHLGQRPYQCSLCGKSFTYSYVLANHMLTHTGEKKYSCEMCNKKFTKAHHLKYHNKVHHKALYLQQQMEQDAKKLHQQINIGEVEQRYLGSHVQLIEVDEETLLSQEDRIKQENYAITPSEGMDQNEQNYQTHPEEQEFHEQEQHEYEVDENQHQEEQNNEMSQHQVLLGTDIRIQHYTDEGGETTIVCEIPENMANQFQGQLQEQIQGQIQEMHQEKTENMKIEDLQEDSMEEETEDILQGHEETS